MKPIVSIVMGSDSDLETMMEAAKVLDLYGIPHEVQILSAHRTPDLVAEYATSARQKGICVIIAGAGMANHLAGAMAAHATIPVIGVPLDGSVLKGQDALLSTVQMPPGIPVACMAIGPAGAKNAAHFAALILGLKDPTIEKKIRELRLVQREKVIKKNQELRKK